MHADGSLIHDGLNLWQGGFAAVPAWLPLAEAEPVLPARVPRAHCQQHVPLMQAGVCCLVQCLPGCRWLRQTR